MSGHDPRLAERIASVQQLGGVVTAMRGIAAARVQQSRKQLEGIRSYADIVAAAIAQVVSMLPAGERDAPGPIEGPRACLLFCTEQGFVGGFNDRVCEVADPLLAAGAPAFVVGARGARLLRLRGRTPVWSTAMIAQAGQVRSVAERVGRALLDELAQGRIAGVDVVHGFVDGAHVSIRRSSLLPLETTAFRERSGGGRPLTYLPPQRLFENLAGEYLFAQLAAAALESHAAENSARMQAMASAQDNIARRLERLQLTQQLDRQDSITDEIIELAGGVL